MARKRSTRGRRRRAAPRRRSVRRYARSVYRSARRGGSKTFSATTVVLGGAGLMAVSPKIRNAVQPVADGIQALTGLSGKDVVIYTIGNRLLCTLVPRVGNAERAVLKTVGLRP